MSHMFKNASNFNQTLKKWNVSKVEKAEQMFVDAKNFNQNLSSWKIAKDAKVDEIFMNSKLATKPPKWFFEIDRTKGVYRNYQEVFLDKVYLKEAIPFSLRYYKIYGTCKEVVKLVHVGQSVICPNLFMMMKG